MRRSLGERNSAKCLQAECEWCEWMCAVASPIAHGTESPVASRRRRIIEAVKPKIVKSRNFESER
jgi:hypothetical protein